MAQNEDHCGESPQKGLTLTANVTVTGPLSTRDANQPSCFLFLHVYSPLHCPLSMLSLPSSLPLIPLFSSLQLRLFPPSLLLSISPSRYVGC